MYIAEPKMGDVKQKTAQFSYISGRQYFYIFVPRVLLIQDSYYLNISFYCSTVDEHLSSFPFEYTQITIVTVTHVSYMNYSYKNKTWLFNIILSYLCYQV